MKERIEKVKLLLLDVDGVLSDGKIIVDSEGREIKVFDVQDGFGIVSFRKAGYKVAILSARHSKATTVRAKDLKVDKVCQDAFPKIDGYRKILKDLKIKDEEVCFMADDLPDLEVFRKVGFAVAVPNAVQEVKKQAHYITSRKGGEGAVREVIELILKTQGKWQQVLDRVGA